MKKKSPSPTEETIGQIIDAAYIQPAKEMYGPYITLYIEAFKKVYGPYIEKFINLFKSAAQFTLSDASNIETTLNSIVTVPIYNRLSWYPISYIREKKHFFKIPKDALPFNVFALGENIISQLRLPSTAVLSSIGTYGGTLFAGWLLTPMMPTTSVASITLQRSGSVGTFGGVAWSETYSYPFSPRLGYQIEDKFKHQAYLKVKSVGSGETRSMRIDWKNFFTQSSIEYAVNNELKRFYLAHGKILYARKYDNEFYVDLFESTNFLNFDFKCDGHQIKMWYGQKEKKFTIKRRENCTIIIEDTKSQNKKTTEEDAKEDNIENYIKTGNFFVLDKPWVLEDPRLLFEYNLNKRNGFYETDEQKYQAVSNYPIKFRGLWLLRPQTLTYNDGTQETIDLWTLYVNYEDFIPQNWFNLPYATPRQLSSEFYQKVQQAAEGMFKNKTPTATSIPEYIQKLKEIKEKTSQEQQSDIKYMNNYIQFAKEQLRGRGHIPSLTKRAEELCKKFLNLSIISEHPNYYISKLEEVTEKMLQEHQSDMECIDNYIKQLDEYMQNIPRQAKESFQKFFNLPITPEDAKYFQEYMDIGGTLEDGLNLIKPDEINSLRVVLFGPGKNTQNFMAPLLKGEFIKAPEDNYFEIIEHPRNDTIEININSINKNSNFIYLMKANKDKEIQIFQQKFWFIKELYYNDGTANRGLWETYEVKKITPWVENNGVVSFTTIEYLSRDVKATIILNNEEKINTGCNYLTERFYRYFNLINPTKSSELADGAYKPYTNWYFYCITNKKLYPIEQIYFEVLKSGEKFGTYLNNTTSPSIFTEKPEIKITIVIKGDISTDISNNVENKNILQQIHGYIFLNYPFDTVSGNYGEMSVNLNIVPAYDNTFWSALLYGHYYSGSYILKGNSYRVVLTDFAYGGFISGEDLDFPMLYLGLQSASSPIACCMDKIGNAYKYLVFFNNFNKYNCLFVRIGNGMIDTKDIEQKVVYIGTSINEEPTTILNWASYSSYKEKVLLDKYIVNIKYDVPTFKDIYVFSLPSNDKLKKNKATKYDSIIIHENHLINTKLSNIYNINQINKLKLIYYPLEYIPSVLKKGPSEEQYYINVNYFNAVQELNKGEQVESLGSSYKSEVEKILNGKAMEAKGKPSNSILEYSYIESNQLINPNYLAAFRDNSNVIFLLYSQNTPEWYIDNKHRQDKNKYLPSGPAVWMIKSESVTHNWTSPIFFKKNHLPLMLLSDFILQSVLFDIKQEMCYLFGYLYDVNNVNGLHLGIYAFPINFIVNYPYNYQNNILLGKSKEGNKMWDILLPNLINENDTSQINLYNLMLQTFSPTNLMLKKKNDIFSILENKYNIYQQKQKSLKQNKYEEASQINVQRIFSYRNAILDNYNDINNINLEGDKTLFASILSCYDADFNIHQIGSTIGERGNLFIFIKIEQFEYLDNKGNRKKVSGIVGMQSFNKGYCWDFIRNNNDDVIIYGDSTCSRPYCCDEYLFMFKHNTLMVQELELTSNKSYIVGENIQPCQIAAYKDEMGILYVFYTRSDGYPCCVFSEDKGRTWLPADNW